MRTHGLSLNGSAVRAIREAQGYNLPTFAKAVGVSVSFMSRAENGIRQPSPQIRARIAEVLGVPLHAVTYTGPSPNEPAPSRRPGRPPKQSLSTA